MSGMVKVRQANKKLAVKLVRREKRKRRIRGRVTGTAMCPRISVFRSNKHFSAQAIDDVVGVTITSVSSYEKENRETAMTVETVKKLGTQFASRLAEKNITKVVFDRNGYRYHGMIRSFADSMRESITF